MSADLAFAASWAAALTWYNNIGGQQSWHRRWYPAVNLGATAAGALLSWLRARSGSLAAPVTLHLAANCGGLLASWLALKVLPAPGRQRPGAAPLARSRCGPPRPSSGLAT